MKGKDVIVGDVHLLGWNRVIVEQATPRENGQPGHVFTVREVETDIVHEVSAGDLGPAGDPIEQKIRAHELMQPHRVAEYRAGAAARRRARRRAEKHGHIVSPRRGEWARHRFSAFSHVVIPSHTKTYEVTAFEFRHELELAAARMFDRCCIQWSPEPTRFNLDGASAFQPDFYLPELDLYVEITQDDHTIKRPKLQGMARHHGDVSVIVLTTTDIERMQRPDRDQVLTQLRAQQELHRRSQRTWRRRWRRKRAASEQERSSQAT